MDRNPMIHVRIPQNLKSQLASFQETQGWTQAQTVTKALELLFQIGGENPPTLG